jgi:hypothetical protein
MGKMNPEQNVNVDYIKISKYQELSINKGFDGHEVSEA